MNRPDKTGEPSMDEILASIRKIIADGGDGPAAAPLMAGTSLDRSTSADVPMPLNERPPPPTFDRFSNALKSKGTPRSLSSALKSKAPFDDLDDLLDVPPVPPMPPPANAAAGDSLDDDLEDLVGPLSEATFTPAPTPPLAAAASSEPATDSEPAADHDIGAAAQEAATTAPPPPVIHSMPPMRSGGFYPPNGLFPGRAKPRIIQHDAKAPEPPAQEPPEPPAADGATHVNGAWHPAQPSWSPADAPAMNGPGEAPGYSPFPGETAPQYADGSAPPHAPAWQAPYDQQPDHRHFGMPPPQGVPRPEPPPHYQGGYGAQRYGAYQAPIDADSSPVVEPPSPHLYRGPEASNAAASALDALAQGLAASSIGAARRPGRPAESPSYGALVAQPMTPALHETNGYPVRTLEDAVTDMLKPLLQQWLADNMPRIIERALRVEAARGVSPNFKGPGG